MENVETKNKIKGLGATIVAGIFLTVAVLFTILLLTMNLKQAVDTFMESVQESANESEDPAAAAIAGSFAAIFGIMGIYLIYYAVVVIPHILAGFMLIPVVKTLRHPDNKAIRIINFVYLGLIVAIITITVIKFILFTAQVG